MNCVCCRARVGLFFFTILISSSIHSLHSQQQKELLIDEGQLRRMATNQPLPEYPLGSLPPKTKAVVVAEVHLSVDGRPHSVEILQSPSESISASVHKCLMTWTFVKGPNYGIHGPFAGKLTFYFVSTDSKSAVYNASDAPYVGP